MAELDISSGNHSTSSVAESGDNIQKAGKPQQGFLEEFFESALYSAVQSPIEGISQLVSDTINGASKLTTGHSAGVDLLPAVHFMEAPQPAAFGSKAWHAQQIGGAVGMLIPFTGVSRIVKGVFARTLLQEGNALARSPIGLSLTEAGVSGFAYDFLMRPTDPQGNGNFLHQRMLNGVSGAATFMTLSAGSSAIGRFSLLPKIQTSVVSPIMKNGVFQSGIAGMPAGFVSHEAEALKQGESLTDWRGIGQSVCGFSMVGGLLAAGHQLKRDVVPRATEAQGQQAGDAPRNMTGGATPEKPKVEGPNAGDSPRNTIGASTGEASMQRHSLVTDSPGLRSPHLNDRPTFTFSRSVEHLNNGNLVPFEGTDGAGVKSGKPPVFREFKVIRGASAIEAVKEGKPDAYAMLRVREIYPGVTGKEGIERSLFVQHTQEGSQLSLNASLADMIATCILPRHLRFKAVVDPFATEVWMSPGLRPDHLRFSDRPVDSEATWGFKPVKLGPDHSPYPSNPFQVKIEGGVRSKEQAIKELTETYVPINDDPQSRVFTVVNAVLSEMQGSGKISKEWKVLQTEVGSPADQIGADAIMFNSRTGALHLLDATSNGSKVETQKNIAAIRRDGVIEFSPRFFTYGKLDMDNADARRFVRRIGEQLESLAETPSLLKLGDAPLPEIVNRGEAVNKMQIDVLIKWLEREAATNHDLEPYQRNLLTEFAKTIGGASRFLDRQTRLAESTEFIGSVGKVTDRVIVNWAAEQIIYGRGSVKANQPEMKGSSLADVRLHKTTDTISLDFEGAVYEVRMSGLDGTLLSSRRRLLERDYLLSFLKKDGNKDTANMKALKDYLRTSSDQEVVKRLLGEITRSTTLIEAGGRLGAGEPTILSRIVAALKNRTARQLLGVPADSHNGSTILGSDRSESTKE